MEHMFLGAIGALDFGVAISSEGLTTDGEMRVSLAQDQLSPLAARLHNCAAPETLLHLPQISAHYILLCMRVVLHILLNKIVLPLTR